MAGPLEENPQPVGISSQSHRLSERRQDRLFNDADTDVIAAGTVKGHYTSWDDFRKRKRQARSVTVKEVVSNGKESKRRRWDGVI